MLNAENESERDRLTRKWRDHKIQELRFVGTVVSWPGSKLVGSRTLTMTFITEGALLAGCLASTGSWPDVLPSNVDKPWTVRATWHSGLIFALFAVIVSCQQSMKLHHLSAYCDGLNQFRVCLGKGPGRDGKCPSGLQMYAWETSLLFLTASIICAIAGLT